MICRPRILASGQKRPTSTFLETSPDITNDVVKVIPPAEAAPTLSLHLCGDCRMDWYQKGFPKDVFLQDRTEWPTLRAEPVPLRLAPELVQLLSRAMSRETQFLAPDAKRNLGLE